jgi:adenylate cyclase
VWFLFEDYVLDTGRRELRRGSTRLSVQPQVFDLLEFLLRHSDRVVSRDDLLASVWGGRIVSESTIASRINAARRTIGDNGEEQRLIRTIIGKGVRFVGEVRELQKPTELGEGPRTRERDLPYEPAIEVLPFANLSGDVDQNYVAAGIFEEIVTALSGYPSLFVVACTDNGRAPDGTQGARDLRVRYGLNGSVRKGVDRIRVTARLVEAETGRHLWAERYDRDLATISTLDDGIAEAVASAAASAIADAERQVAMRRSPGSLDAWSAYQCGLWHVGKFSRQDNAFAQRFFRHAIELDPAFSGGYKGLALGRVQEAGVYQIRELDEILRSAEGLARQAVALAGRDSEARAYLSTTLWMRGNCESALAEAERALELSPNLARGHDALGSALTLSGRPREGIVALEKALSLDAHEAMWPSRLHLLGLGLYLCREYDATIETAKRAIHANPDYPLPYRWLAAALGQVGRIPEAKRVLATAIAIAPDLFHAYVRKRVPSLRPEDHAHMLDGLRKAGWRG